MQAFLAPTVPIGELNTFYIDKNTEKISLTEFLDYETIQQYRFVVKVTDGGGKFVSKNNDMHLSILSIAYLRFLFTIYNNLISMVC